MRTFVIGDIHACLDELYSLLKLFRKEEGLNFARDKIVFLGDYIDRGPKGPELVQQLIDWKRSYPHWVFLRGNHEHLLGDYVEDTGKYDTGVWLYNGGFQTIKDYFAYGAEYGRGKNWDGVFPGHHVDFLTKQTELYHEDSKYFYVHAGVSPKKSLNEFKEGLDALNEEDIKTALWIRDEFIDDEIDYGKKIIFGHTARRNPYWGIGYKELGREFIPIIKNNKIGLDTAVCPPGNCALTGIVLPKEQIYGVVANNSGKY